MPDQTKFTQIFAPETIDHLGVIERKYHQLIQQTIDEQTSYTPEQASRNRKTLEQPAPFGATWELRCGPSNRFRVFYEVDQTARTVSILAIGIKIRDRLFVGGREIKT